MNLDHFDIKLLNALQKDNQLTGAQLSEMTNLSPASCLRRIQRLRHEGVIIGDVSVISPDALPSQITVVVLVTVEREQQHLMEAFKQEARRAPEIRQCYYVSGDVDFVLIVNVPTLEKYDAFIQRFFFERENIRRFVTMVSLNRVKYETGIPISLESYNDSASAITYKR